MARILYPPFLQSQSAFTTTEKLVIAKIIAFFFVQGQKLKKLFSQVALFLCCCVNRI